MQSVPLTLYCRDKPPIYVTANVLAASDQLLYALSATCTKASAQSLVRSFRGTSPITVNIRGKAQVHRVDRYIARLCHLTGSHWHVVAVAAEPRFLPNISDDALWGLLTGPLFTTPLLRAWVPYIRQQMLRQSLLRKMLASLNCDACLCLASDGQLDAIVRAGVQRRMLMIEEAEA